MDNLVDYYRKGTEGIKIIYICVFSSFIYWIINFISVKFFAVSVDSFFLLSAGSFLPFSWTVLTFPFIHHNLWDLLFTMIMIYFTEKIFRMFFDGKSFIKFFFLGNIAGAILFLFFSFLTGETFVFLSGAVLGVYSSIFAIISYNPKMQVILFPLPFRLPLYAFGLILLALDTFSTVGQGQITGLFIARLGAAGFGYFYMKSFQQGNDFLGRWIPDFSNNSKISSVFKKKPKSRLNVKKSGYQQKKEYTRPQTDEEFSINKIAKQKQIDKILDKISKSGYDSLTKEEKDFLFNSSK